ncbi:hypothetical protein [Nitrospira lenta]|uniref:Uncharacterized protein n=1 Tax=Nitrospira lenta TaxID=1436998 RepID=A0A330L4M7_9BACT|nr:hypothetical protein [Nitrospira lenta]SPP64637.1 hypothetical protein NITLEN_20277 [Nitrospira lenta]
MSLGEIFDSLRSDDLVGKFKKELVDAGVKIAEDRVAKYFAAEKEIALLLLAHESNLEKGWWGIHQDIVARVINSEPVKTNHLGWGAILLHKSCRRGYWIPGDDLFQLKTLRLVTLGNEGQYHFNQDNLDKAPGIAKQFFSIKTFLLQSGLQKN